jgi:hypothetical protein
MPYTAASDTAEAQAAAVAQAAVVAVVAAEIAATRKALLGSEKTLIQGCLSRLEQAAVAFQDAFQGMTPPGPPDVQPAPAKLTQITLRRDLTALRKDLAVVAGLAQSGAALYQGLARLLGAAAGGYTSQGDGAPLQPSVGVVVRG